jgi:adenylate cyclase
MTLRPRTFVVLCGFVPTVAAALLCLYRPALLSNLEYSVYDVLMRSAPTRPPDSRIAIVDVDERSLSAVGQWPWRRDVVGSLISRLRDLGAATVSLDIMFAESDRFRGGADTDDLLAATLREGKVILGYALTFDKVSTKASACVEHPIGLAVVRRDDDQGGRTVLSRHRVNLQPAGADQRRRRLRLSQRGAGSRTACSAAFRCCLNWMDASTGAVAGLGHRRHPRPRRHARHRERQHGDADRRSAHVPPDGKSNLLVRYRGIKRTFPYFSAADVMSGVAPSDAFRDKLVFVGTTALGTREVVATPLDTLFAGVEVQATVADNLLQQDFIRRPEYGVTVETQAVLALGIAGILLVGRFGLPWGAAGMAVFAVATWAAATSVFTRYGVFISPLFPTLGLGGALAAMTAARFVGEHRRADKAVEDTETSQRLMVQSLLSLTEVRDAETGRHSRRTQRYTKVLADQLARDPRYAAALSPATIELLSSLAPLHDIGKVGVPDRLLNKPGDLTKEELAEMRKHPAHGRDVIAHAQRDVVGAQDNVIMEMARTRLHAPREVGRRLSSGPEGRRHRCRPPDRGDVYDAA